MKSKRMEFALFWLPLIGGILLGGIAGNAWYGGNKVLGLWLGFAGVICLGLIAVLQIQQSLLAKPAKDTGGNKPPRAFVSIESGGMQVVPLKEGGLGIAVHIVLKNSDQSPAHNFTTWIKKPVILEPGAIPFDDPRPLNERTAKSIVAAGASVSIDWILPITEDELKAVKSWLKNIFVWGGANYTDESGVDRYFIFRDVNGPDRGNTFGLNPHKLGYEAN